jgi:caffeoyl-CoA O-methyltransferase
MNDEELEAYATDHTSAEPVLMEQLARETIENMKFPSMLTGKLQGSLLRMLVELIAARRVLEVGMFTGYATLMMASALPEDGELITCEVDPKAETIARQYFAKSAHGHKIEIQMGPAVQTITSLDGPFDFAYIDADKENYPTYYELCLDRLRAGGVIAIDNVLWSGKVLEPKDEASRAIAALNATIQVDPRVDNVLLPIRDGLMLVLKKQHADDPVTVDC